MLYLKALKSVIWLGLGLKKIMAFQQSIVKGFIEVYFSTILWALTQLPFSHYGDSNKTITIILNCVIGCTRITKDIWCHHFLCLQITTELYTKNFITVKMTAMSIYLLSPLCSECGSRGQQPEQGGRHFSPQSLLPSLLGKF